MKHAYDWEFLVIKNKRSPSSNLNEFIIAFLVIVRLMTVHTELDKHMPTNDQIDALLARYMV